jgi:hypothetical protein
MTLTELPSYAVVEFETEYYTDWRCSKCHALRRRDYPARVIRKGKNETVQCREHGSGDDDDEKCGCHCHEMGVCEECGEESGQR